MNPLFPLYIPSKGRYEFCRTMRVLEGLGVPYFVVVEEPEYKAYCSALGKERILVLDMAYKRNYETCDDLGDTKSKGAGPARNFAWDHAISSGHPWHWVMNDNIGNFQRLHNNRRIKVSDGTGFRAMEEFCLRYENVGIAGPQYSMFAPSRIKWPPFVANTRIYSCNLIRNDIPFRWRGRYNEDTILSLDALKGGWCTIQFNAFLQSKLQTSKMKGGNTAEFYSKEGTYPKSKMLKDVHPDVTRIVTRWDRAHHYVDYRPFKTMKLIRKPDLCLDNESGRFKMELVHINEKRESD
jgi:hypothetical protein